MGCSFVKRQKEKKDDYMENIYGYSIIYREEEYNGNK